MRVHTYGRIALVVMALVLHGCFSPGLGQQQQVIFKSDASYSPDGSKISFVSNADGDFEIYIMNADGSGLKKLTDNEENDYDVKWSPDGSRLLFSSDRTEQWELYVMRTDGSDVRMIPIGL